MTETPKSPLLEVDEQLMAFRKQLVGVFTELHIVRDVSIIAYTVIEDCNPKLSTLIRHHIMMDIDEQMRAVSRMVEALGGKTEYAEEQPPNVAA